MKVNHNSVKSSEGEEQCITFYILELVA